MRWISLACWIVVTTNGRYTYTTNTGSNSITGYRIGSDGSLAILDADGKTADTGATPIDMALTKSSRLLYALAGGVRCVTAWHERVVQRFDWVAKSDSLLGTESCLMVGGTHNFICTIRFSRTTLAGKTRER